MSKRKYKKHGYADLLKYMRLLEEGHSFNSIHQEYGISHLQLKVQWAKYLSYGTAGLRKSLKIKIDFILKRKIVVDIEKKSLTFAHSFAKVWCQHFKYICMAKALQRIWLSCIKKDQKARQAARYGKTKKEQ